MLRRVSCLQALLPVSASYKNSHAGIVVRQTRSSLTSSRRLFSESNIIFLNSVAVLGVSTEDTIQQWCLNIRQLVLYTFPLQYPLKELVAFTTLSEDVFNYFLTKLYSVISQKVSGEEKAKIPF